MSASVTFGDDPRVVAYAAWIASDVESGIPQEGDLQFAVQATIQSNAVERGPNGGPGIVVLLAQKLHGFLMKLHGMFVIDQTGGVNGTIASPEEIAHALQGNGYSVAVIVSQKAKDLRPLTPFHWSSSDSADREVDRIVPDRVADPLTGLFSALSPDAAEALTELIAAARNADLDWRVVRHLGPQLSPQLDRAVPEVGANPDQLPMPNDAPVYDGKGVIIGVVDFGCDFAHPNFRQPGGSSRLLWIWDMNNDPAGPPPPLPPIIIPLLPPVQWPGRGLYRAAIDAALDSTQAPPNYVQPDDRPYFVLRYHPHDNYYADKVTGGAHGTFVLDVAGGNGLATRDEERFRVGVAPGADLAFVQIPKPRVVGCGCLPLGRGHRPARGRECQSQRH